MIVESFDVFLSHSSTDKRHVARLAEGLRQRGLRPWLDVERSVPGERFPADIASGLAASRCLAVFVGAQDVGGWVEEEMYAALTRSVVDRSFRVFLVLLPGAPDPFDHTALHSLLSQRSWVDLRDLAAEESVELLARAVRGEPLGLVDPAVSPPGGPAGAVGESATCPFVGLRAFREDEAAWFFGRDADIQRMAEKLRAARFLAVLGRSGVGKSSVVRAGLVPALRAGRFARGAAAGPVRLLQPTGSPLEVLAAHVSRLRPDLAVGRIVDDLATSDVALKVMTAAADHDQAVLWVVDQAEELFTLCTDADERRSFASNLLHASQSGPAQVVVALRSDFYPRFAELGAFGDRMAQHQHVVGDLGQEQVRQVVTDPAALAGLRFEPGLVARIVDEVRDQSSALPLLQHTLLELWERRRGPVLTHEAYDDIGGVRGALGNHADGALAALDDVDIAVARRLLVDLVRLGDDVDDAKQPVRLSRLVAPAYPIGRLHCVAAVLADARLVTTDASPGAGADTVVELAHEALIGCWSRLRAWLDHSRDELRTRRRIRNAALEWDDQDRHDDLLYRGTVLALAREHLDGREAEMHQLESDFLAASVTRETAERSGSRRRRAQVMTALSTLSVLMLVAAVVATGMFVRSRDAQRDAEANAAAADVSAARAMAEQARALSDLDPALAVAVAAEAHARLGTAETGSALQAAVLAHGRTPGHRRRVLLGHKGAVTAVAFSADRKLLTAGADRTIRVWDPDSATTTVLEGHDASVVTLAISPDGTQFASTDVGGMTLLWDLRSGLEPVDSWQGVPSGVVRSAFHSDGHRLVTATVDGTAIRDVDSDEVVELPAIPKGIVTVAFSPASDLLATATPNGLVQFWDPGTGNIVDELAPHRPGLSAIAFQPGGSLLALAQPNGTTTLRDLAADRDVTSLPGHTGPILGVTFSRDGKLLATVGTDGRTGLWNVENHAEPATLPPHGDQVLAVAFDQETAQLATAGRDGAVKLWNPGTPGTVTVLRGHTDEIDAIDFSPDGTNVVTGSFDGTARIWHAATGTVVRPVVHGSQVRSVAYSPDGDVFATTGENGLLRIWDAATGVELHALPHGEPTQSATFNRDGSVVAVAVRDGSVHRWDPHTGRRLGKIVAHDHQVLGAAFSPDGKLLATGGEDGDARVWDLTTGERIARLRTFRGDVGDVIFTPDGGLLFSGDAGGGVISWDPRTGDEQAILSRHSEGVLGLDLTGDGRILASASLDGTVKLHDARTGEEIATLEGHTSGVTDVAFNEDGTLLATAGQDQQAIIRRLVLDPGEACELIQSEVTSGELTRALNGSPPQACTELV